ncbi:hypothetical protein DFJ63DRAFT_103653 [Scheffersomyces coipomensis]|uniref:uncharacterized protein n=1 Tax=Scheffersomyces coipomensis TaxID=1788519 RepID=UPI00315D9FB1
MFDDQITRDENYFIQNLEHSHENQLDYIGSINHVSGSLKHTADDYLSKDSEVFKLMYGRANGPDRSTSFYTQFPRKSTNLDSEYHQVNLDSDILSRWIPRSVLKVFIPVLYFEDMRREAEMKRLSRKNGMEYLMIARPVPTMAELASCANLKGKGLWDRSGTWFCTSQKTQPEPDEYGPKSFSSFNSWITWDHNINLKIEEAKHNEQWDDVKKLREIKNVSLPVGRKF